MTHKTTPTSVWKFIIIMCKKSQVALKKGMSTTTTLLWVLVESLHTNINHNNYIFLGMRAHGIGKNVQYKWSSICYITHKTIQGLTILTLRICQLTPKKGVMAMTRSLYWVPIENSNANFHHNNGLSGGMSACQWQNLAISTHRHMTHKTPKLVSWKAFQPHRHSQPALKGWVLVTATLLGVPIQNLHAKY